MRGMEHPRSLEDGVYLRSFGALRPYNPADPEVTVLRRILSVALLALAALLPTPAQQAPQETEQILWLRLEVAVIDVARNLDSVLALAILDLATGPKCVIYGDQLRPTA